MTHTMFGRFGSGGAVLCYHAIVSGERPGDGVSNVPLERFSETIDLLSRRCRFLPLSQLADRVASGRSRRGDIALTFDDAYESVLRCAAPLLAQLRIPFSVFVTTQATDAARTFWWDRIDDLFPRVSEARWRSFESGIGLPRSYAEQTPPEYGPLRPLRQWLLAEFHGRWPQFLEPHLSALEAEHGFATVQRAMSFREIDTLRAMCDVEVGTHTLTHPVLPLLDTNERAREVGGAYEELRARYADVIPVLAVPFGLYDAATLESAKRAGMRASLTLNNCTLARGHPAGDPLPRLSITRDYTPGRIALAALGVVDAVKGRPALHAYPELPSPST